MKRRELLMRAAGITLLPSAGTTSAQSFPNKSITLIVPFAPGGNLDVVGRTLAPSLERVLGQHVIVENRAGGGGAVGASAVARSTADGYTLLVTTPNAIAVLPQMTSTTYKLENFQPIGLVAATSLVLTVRNNDGRFRDTASVLNQARANPGKLTAGHAGPGTTSHLALLKLEDAAHIELNTVPYKGSSPALIDLMSGQIDLMVDQLTSSAPHIQSGALRAVAVLSRDRDPALPAVPTLREGGLRDFDASTVTGLIAPKGTPQSIVEILNNAIRKALADEDVRTRLLSVGSVVRPSTTQEFQRILAQEDERAQSLARASKLRVD